MNDLQVEEKLFPGPQAESAVVALIRLLPVMDGEVSPQVPGPFVQVGKEETTILAWVRHRLIGAVMFGQPDYGAG